MIPSFILTHRITMKTKPKAPKFKDNKIIRRKFLNKKEGLAAIETFVTTDFDSVSASVEISDCHRKINLDFYSYSSSNKDTNLRLEKLDTIINTLQEFRQDYINAKEDLFCRKPIYEAYRKEKLAWQKANNEEPSIFDRLEDHL